jgi:hypothetical protein
MKQLKVFFSTKRSTAVLSLVFAVFAFLIIGLLYTVYEKSHRFPSSHITAIKTQIKLSSLPLYNDIGKRLPETQWNNQWLVFYVAPLPCRRQCQHNIAKLDDAYHQLNPEQVRKTNVIIASFLQPSERKLKTLSIRMPDKFFHVNIKRTEFIKLFSHLKSLRKTLFQGKIFLIDRTGDFVREYDNKITATQLRGSITRVQTRQYD